MWKSHLHCWCSTGTIVKGRADLPPVTKARFDVYLSNRRLVRIPAPRPTSLPHTSWSSQGYFALLSGAFSDPLFIDFP